MLLAEELALACVGVEPMTDVPVPEEEFIKISCSGGDEETDCYYCKFCLYANVDCDSSSY